MKFEDCADTKGFRHTRHVKGTRLGPRTARMPDKREPPSDSQQMRKQAGRFDRLRETCYNSQ